MTFLRPCVRVVLFLGAWCVSAPTSVGAQQTASGASGGEVRELTEGGVPLTRALGVAEGPVIDGDVLSDPAYADARLATGFVQSRPFQGQPSSERTEVRIVHTNATLYFGIVCYTDDPSTIIAADSRRDSDLTDTDSFRIMLDTYLDGQNGFIFGTSPAGVEYDGQVTNEGQGSGRTGGGGRRTSRFPAGGVGWWLQPQLGWRLAGRDECDRHRVDRRDRDSVSHAPVSDERRAIVGDELPAQHPSPKRTILLVADAASIRHQPDLAGG